MYPKNNLYWYYEKYNQTSWLSNRLPDFTKRYTIDGMNKAINCCEKWNSFLDVGAGSGHYSIPLLYKFNKGTAIEPGKSSDLQILTKLYRKYSWHHGTFQTFKSIEKVDFILLSDVFEHLPERSIRTFIKRMSKIQSQGGVVYILTPNPLFCGPAEKSALYYRILPYGHHKHYLREEIEKLFAKSGYRLVHADFEEGWWRRYFKIILLRASIYDKKWVSNHVYRLMSHPLILVIRWMLFVISLFIYQTEKNNRYNSDNAMSASYIFKKI